MHIPTRTGEPKRKTPHILSYCHRFLIARCISTLCLLLILQVKDDLCDYPCSPDKSYCFVYACCGSRDGAYYTVAFAGQVRVCMYYPIYCIFKALIYNQVTIMKTLCLLDWR